MLKIKVILENERYCNGCPLLLIDDWKGAMCKWNGLRIPFEYASNKLSYNKKWVRDKECLEKNS